MLKIGTTTLALFPTQIHSQYCTNPTWLSAAIANPTLFNTTLYVASVHDAGLHGCRDTVESLFYKAQTIQVLNEALRNPAQAVSDETLSAVLLLTHIVVSDSVHHISPSTSLAKNQTDLNNRASSANPKKSKPTSTVSDR